MTAQEHLLAQATALYEADRKTLGVFNAVVRGLENVRIYTALHRARAIEGVSAIVRYLADTLPDQSEPQRSPWAPEGDWKNPPPLNHQ